MAPLSDVPKEIESHGLLTGKVSAEGVGRHYGARKDGGLLDGWFIHETDTADVPGVEVRAVPLLMQSDELSAAMVHSALELAGV